MKTAEELIDKIQPAGYMGIGKKNPVYTRQQVLDFINEAAQFQQESVDVINKRITELEWYR